MRKLHPKCQKKTTVSQIIALEEKVCQDLHAALPTKRCLYILSQFKAHRNPVKYIAVISPILLENKLRNLV